MNVARYSFRLLTWNSPALNCLTKNKAKEPPNGIKSNSTNLSEFSAIKFNFLNSFLLVKHNKNC